MESNLYLHIGFPKTGTTSIQEILLTLEGYAGKFVEGKSVGNKTYTQAVRGALGLNSRGSDWTSSIAHFVRLTQNTLAARKQESKTGVIYSDEDLVLRGPVRGGGADFVSHHFKSSRDSSAKSFEEMPLFHGLRRGKWPFNRNIHILLTIRRQWDLLPSLYRERSNRNLYAGQEDFDKLLSQWLRWHSWWLDYARWAAKLLEFGQVNSVTIIPIEYLNKSEYFNGQMRAFLGRHWRPTVGLPITNDAPKDRRGRIPLKAISGRSQGAGQITTGGDKRAEKSVALKPHQLQEVQMRFHWSNQILQEFTDADLRSAGYF